MMKEFVVVYSDVSDVSAVSAVSDVSAVFDVFDVSVNIHSIFDFPTIGNSFVKKELPWPSHRTPAATTLTPAANALSNSLANMGQASKHGRNCSQSPLLTTDSKQASFPDNARWARWRKCFMHLA